MAKASLIDSFTNAAKGFGRLPITRQFGLLVGLSASIALGFAVVLWSQKPEMRPIFTHLTAEETSEVLDALQEINIPFKVDQKSGAILVPTDKAYNVRFHLASQGLPRKSGFGFEELDKESGFGTSRFMENARYRHALEGELSRTISNLQNVRSARVHLALPKESVFVGDHQHPTASVLVDLASGHELDANQVQAISHLVSSSVPNMEKSFVTVVDQEGHLLTGSGMNDGITRSRDQFNYKSQLEDQYVKRIEGILTPLLGHGKVKARVSADIDFTQLEQTEERYKPDSKVVRSEQIMSEPLSGQSAAVGGVPGALSNQPPAEGSATTDTSLQPKDETTSIPSTNTKSQAIRNYELGKTISHAQMPVGQLKHLSVAVVVDERTKTNPDTGEVTHTPLSEDEIAKITTLVENAVGYDQARGDKISVINIPFVEGEIAEPLAELPLWKQPWFWKTVKMSLGVIFILLIFFMILRPMIKNLASKAIDDTSNPSAQGAAGALGAPSMPGAMGMPGQMAYPQPGSAPMQYPQGVAYSPQAMAGGAMGMMPQAGPAHVQQMVGDDPMKIAQVMKSWIGDSA